MLKRTSASVGLVIAAAAGAAPLTISPAYAHASLAQGWHGHHRHHSRHHFRHYSRHHSHNRNWNGNRLRPRIFIRIYVVNRNNNKAIAVAARPERRRERPVLVARDTDPIAIGLDRGFARPAVTRAHRAVNSPNAPVQEGNSAPEQGAVDGATPAD